MTHRAIRRSGVRVVPYLANALILLTFVYGSLSLLALLLAAFVHVAARRELRLRETHHRQAQSVAERLDAVLIPLPVHPNDLILHACRRAALTEAQKRNRGLQALATISATAPCFGFLGTFLGSFSSFKGSTGEKSAIIAATTHLNSESLVPTAPVLTVVKRPK
jgi:biopolymer transport protein ExbB/TolQ